MSLTFVIGREYKRPKLMEFVGSQQHQSGVLWGPREPGCVICTSGGRHGKKVGYLDQPLADGSWYYFGQGRAGNQTLANSANAKLAGGDRSVLLFTTREPSAKEVKANESYRKLFTFRGAFNVVEHTFLVAADGPRAGDSLIRFHLVPVDEDGHDATVEPLGGAQDPTALRLALAPKAASGAAPTSWSLAEYRLRSAAVHRYAILRADGSCEACRKVAPFMRDDGQPYLEVHHINRLADDGPDAPENVAALCPNCHRAAHHSKDRDGMRARLASYVLEAEEAMKSRY